MLGLRRIALSIALLCVGCEVGWTTIRNVPTEFLTIQGAIDASANGDEIIVGMGTYHERINFAGKAIVVRGLDPNNPSTVAATIIDGDDGGSVVTFDSGETASSVLTGFTITDGSAATGGGIHINGGAPTITRNVICANVASSGGGIYNGAVGAAVITSNTITGNSADLGGGIWCQADSVIGGNLITFNVVVGNGAALFLNESAAIVGGNDIIDNAANSGAGGGIYAVLSDGAVVRGNVIRRNAAAVGGGLYLAESFVAITGNVISGNTASTSGGGIHAFLGIVTLVNDTLSGNGAPTGGGMYNDSCVLTVRNTIVAASTDGGGICGGAGPDPSVSYCDVHGNTDGDYVSMPNLTGTGGNISALPLFASPGADDYRLKSVGGRWNGSLWVKDAATSPCIDAGDPATVFANEPAFNGGRVNMGFDGDTEYASKTPVPEVVKATPKHVGAVNTLPFTASFNVPMHRVSVQNNFSISPTKTGSFSWVGKKLVFTPDTPWTPNRWYTVTIAKAARSATGVKMASDFTWAFKTVAPTLPAAVSVAAAPTAAGVEIVTTLAAPASVTAAICNLAGRTVAVLPDRELAAGTTTLLWSGRSDSGTQAPAGQYLVKLTARTADGAQAAAVALVRLR